MGKWAWAEAESPSPCPLPSVRRLSCREVWSGPSFMDVWMDARTPYDSVRAMQGGVILAGSRGGPPPKRWRRSGVRRALLTVRQVWSMACGCWGWGRWREYV